jgi:hypothetical protein
VTGGVAAQLAAIFATAAIGWAAARWRLFGADVTPALAARVLSAAAFAIFVPALLFRTTARIDLAALPWRTLGAFFVPVVGFGLVAFAVNRRRLAHQGPAAAATYSVSVTFGNSVQIGIPLAAALYGEAGLSVHIPLVALHALVLLSVATVLAEFSLARDRARREGAQPLVRVLAGTVRQTVVHPVVLPVLVGLAWNLGGVPLPAPLDAALAGLAAAVVPLCLVLIGVNLAQYGLAGRWPAALGTALLKLVALPAAVLAAGLAAGLSGVVLAVLVLMAALPVGSNALLFADRYGVRQAESTAAIVVSTVAFVATLPAWLAVLAAVG